MNSIPSFKYASAGPLQPNAFHALLTDEEDELTQRFQAVNKGHTLAWQLPAGLDEKQAAQKCLELVEEHPAQISTLLAHQPGVAAEAIDLLCTLHAAPVQARQFAKVIVEAGYRLDRPGKLPDSVTDFVNERQAKQQNYWNDKVRKNEEYRNNGGKNTGPYHNLKSYPHPHLSTKDFYSTTNYNGKIEVGGERMVCRHMAEAVGHVPTAKETLKKFAVGDMSGITAEMIAKHKTTDQKNGSLYVEFSRCNFGRLMNVLMQELSPGETRSFAVRWLHARASRGDSNHAHAMQVELKKDNSESPTVLLYEPNVSGNRTRLRELPENLTHHDFDAYDSKKLARSCGADVLSIKIDNAELAQSLAGRFVEPDKEHQRLALTNAMRRNNAGGVEAALKGMRHHEYSWDSESSLFRLDDAFKYCDPAIALRVLSQMASTPDSGIPSSTFKKPFLKGVAGADINFLRNWKEAVGNTFDFRSEQDQIDLAIAVQQAAQKLANNRYADKNAVRSFAKTVIELQKDPNTRLGRKGAAEALASLLATTSDPRVPPYFLEKIFLEGVEAADVDLLKDWKEAVGDAFDFRFNAGQELLSNAVKKAASNLGDNRFADDKAVRSFAETVIELQKDPNTQLRGREAANALKSIRGAHQGIFKNTAEYNRNVKSDTKLYDLFKAAKQSLRSETRWYDRIG